MREVHCNLQIFSENEVYVNLKVVFIIFRIVDEKPRIVSQKQRNFHTFAKKYGSQERFVLNISYICFVARSNRHICRKAFSFIPRDESGQFSELG